ncbi:MAG: Zn-dependent hydrolase of the beta-lactamase fold-like protein [Parcubacteria group bacterium GW2011_GWA2_50_10b]|nr:MAG: Zn-dependent hydrolase of the beta-lactamase fold-like protein [Parcubacteria group bacterium GW2011_GWA2_50_10b]
MTSSLIFKTFLHHPLPLALLAPVFEDEVDGHHAHRDHDRNHNRVKHKTPLERAEPLGPALVSVPILAHYSTSVKREKRAYFCYNYLMIISYQGVEGFKISQGELTLAVNPQSKISAAVTLFTGSRAETAEKSGFVIAGPGEYEIKDVFIKGFLSEAKDKLNTIYLISFEGLKLCFLGSLFNPQLPTKTLEAIEDIDILFVPVGGNEVLEPSAAYKLAVSLEPSVIIPMHYAKPALDQFIKEGGDKVEALDKFVVKKKDLEGKESEIVVLKEE